MRSIRALVIGGVAAVLLAACSDFIVDGRTLAVDAIGTVHGFVFLDADGTGDEPGEGDDPLEGVRMRLVATGGGGDVRDVETDEEGFFAFDEAPVGEFRVLLDPESVPDSIEVLEHDDEPFVLARGDTVQRTLRLSFPTYSIEEVRELPPGQRVFTHGIALNARVNFGDGVVHLRDGDFHLRATSVDRTTLSPGDSVRFLGRTDTDQGHPVLTDVRPFVLVPEAALPQPVDVSTEEGASADEGALDAALVRIRDAVVLDTIPAGGDLVVVTDDGSGPVDVLLRDFIQISGPFRQSLVPDSARVDVGVGLLVPVEDGVGVVRWRLLPRAQSDLQVSEIEFEDE